MGTYWELENKSRPNKSGGEKEEMVLDWTCPEERSEQRLCCCPWMEARGEEKKRQTQNFLASHCSGGRQTDKDGAHGQERGRQQKTASSGGKMFGACCASWNKAN